MEQKLNYELILGKIEKSGQKNGKQATNRQKERKTKVKERHKKERRDIF